MKKMSFFVLIILFLGACVSTSKPTIDDVLLSFKEAKLEAENPIKMGVDDYGAAPYVCEGKRFFIPSLGDDKGGRVFICNNNNDRDNLAKYYQDLGKSSALFYSWVFIKGDIVVQINGNLSEDIARKYEEAIP